MQVSHVLTIILRKVDYEGDQNTDGVTENIQILINAKLEIGKRGQTMS